MNEAVMRNKEKFPERFSWKLTEKENNVFWSQIATSSLKSYGGRRYYPLFFTEQEIAMFSSNKM